MNNRSHALGILVTMLAIFASQSNAQHSLQLDDGAGNIGIITGPTSGGTSMFTLPSAPGTLITTGTGPMSAWLLQGNSLSVAGASPTQWFGTFTNDDVIMKANNVVKLRLVSGGGVVIPGTALSIGGVAYTFPAAAPNGVLTNTAGVLSWAVAASSEWATTGNAGTTYGTNFIGTTDDVGLMFKVNSQVAGRIESGTAVTALGYRALDVNTGTSNTAIGYFALRSNTTGFWNTAVGGGALASNTIGIANTASGLDALGLNTTASRNVALGYNALVSQSFSNGGVVWISNNTAVGYDALRNNQPTNTSNGVNNTAIGSEALRSNTTGFNNTASGGNSLRANTSGVNNTALGSFALWSNTTASGNTALGSSTLQVNTTGSDNTASGIGALGANTTGSNNTASGKSALQDNTTASQNVAIGNLALLLQSYSNGGVAWNSNNTAVGYEALRNNQPTSTSNGVSNTATGFQALRANTTGSLNTASGASALLSNTTGAANTALGFQSLNVNSTGGSNTASGYQSLTSNTTGGSNTATGTGALNSNTTGSLNTATGGNALQSNTTGDLNTAIGYLANVSSGALSNATAIGANAIVDASNKIQLGNTSVTLVSTEGDYQTGLGDKVIFRNPAGTFNTTFKAGAQLVALDYTLPTLAPTAGQVLSSDAAGILSWATTGGISGTGTTNTIPKWTSASAIGNSALTDNGTTLGYGFFFSLTSGQITTLGGSFSNSSSNGRIMAITNTDNNSGLGNSRGLDINLPNGAGAGNTYTGIKFNVVGGAGFANDMLGTGSTWKVTSAGAATFTALKGAATNKYAEQHTIAGGEIAGNAVTINNTIVAGATSVVIANLVSGTGGYVLTSSAAAGSVTITFNAAPTAGDIVNYIVVNP